MASDRYILALVALLVLVGVPASGPRADDAEPMDEMLISEPEPLDPDLLPEKRRVSLSAHMADIKSVLLTVADQVGLDLIIDPDVRGTVTIEVTDKALDAVLDAIISQSGYHYRLHDGPLRVYGEGLQTRMFTVDYVTGIRIGSTRLAASSGGGGESSDGGGGESSVSVDSQVSSNPWADIIKGLEMIVFGGSEGQAEIGGAGGDVAGGDLMDDSSFEGSSGDEGDGVGVRERLVVHPHSGVVLVTASFSKLNRVADFLERIEGSTHRQVFIEAEIAEVVLSKERHLGIDWSQIPVVGDVTDVFGQDEFAVAQDLSLGDAVFGAAFSEGDFDVFLNALGKQGDVKVISSPRVTTLNNQKAIIKVAREESFFSQQIDYETQPDGSSEPIITVEPERVTIGLVLDVTPQISADGDIMMNIHPSITELVGEDVFPPGATGMNILANAPILDIREVDAVVRVRNGHALVIGGLMKERVREDVSMVPFLGRIPLLGHLFRRTDRIEEHVELVIVLRPRVMVGREANEFAMRELERSEGAY